MLHYHGTPVGGTAASADEFVRGRFVLIPWKRPDDLRRALACSRGFIVDNSAFSFWSTKETPDWNEYITWLKSFCRNPRFHFALIPDVIEGSEHENDELIRLWDRQCWWPIRVQGCPVWHLHESIGRLQRLVRHWPYVAMGSSGQWPTPGVGAWWDRMDETFAAITDENGYPLTRIHGLRMLRRDIVERYPFASCDSTNAVQNGSRQAAQVGTDVLWGSLTLARRIEGVCSPSQFVAVQDKQAMLF